MTLTQACWIRGFPAAFLLLATAVVQGAEKTPSKELYFPPTDGGEWQTADPASAGFAPEKLKAVFDYAREQRSSGVVILHNGRLVAEEYWDADEPKGNGAARGRSYDQRVVGKDAAGHVIEDVASAQKSVSSILCGMAQERGLLKITDPVSRYLGAGWSKGTPEQEGAITVRHLLTMTSGLDEQLNYEAPAGTVWMYNTTAYSRTLMCTAAAAKLNRDELTKAWLTDPIGMHDTRWAERASPGVAAVNAVGLATTARDLARFGLLILANGDWNGEPVIRDKQFLHDALHPSQTLNPSYGYLWWLNGQSQVRRGRQLVKGPLIPTAPADLVAALGANHRKCYVVPSLGLVVTRLGDNPPEAPDIPMWKLIMEARSDSK